MRFTPCLALTAMWVLPSFTPALAAEKVATGELLEKADAAWNQGSRAQAIALCTQALQAEPANLKTLV